MICSNCGRKLKSEASREAGYGPVCYRKMFGITLQSNQKGNISKTIEAAYYNIPGQMTIEEYMQAISE